MGRRSGQKKKNSNFWFDFVKLINELLRLNALYSAGFRSNGSRWRMRYDQCKLYVLVKIFLLRVFTVKWMQAKLL